jgi:hypothetical protein
MSIIGSSKNLLITFLQDPSTGSELETKYPEKDLREAVEATLGWSILHLIKKDRPISLSDLQTDLRDAMTLFADLLKDSQNV